MTDPHDETGYRAGEAPDLSPSALPRAKGHLDDEDLGRLIVHRTPFPGLMLLTGALWILAGAAYLALFGLLRLLDIPFQSSDVWMVICGAFFVKDGMQLMRGKFRDPSWDGVLTIVIGVISFGHGWYQFAETGSAMSLVFGIFFGCLLLVPGILVLVGRKQYLVWKAEQECELPGAL